MKRHWVFALAVLVAIPRLAHAQDDGWGPKFRLTPYIGISPGINQNGAAGLFTPNGVSEHIYRLEYSGSIPLGLNLDYRVWNGFSVVGGGVWSRRGDGSLIDFEDELIYDLDGTNFWMAKLGLGIRLNERNTEMQLRRLAASIFIAPAIVHDAPNSSLTTPAISSSSISQFGLNLGVDAELPLANNRFAFSVGLEDWIIFWDKTNYATRLGGYFQQLTPNLETIAIETKNTSLFVLRTGLTFRF